ncbi:triose-phosphate isomerase [Dongia sedimenti]|uniref:Triosephosphate isomerase n=1 Tax=Dongia sedimenti TaxID=3064282 RepID=A0ABU0YMQ4_9PROT|nr:triose-phosphate isomerase [Rhodospirillaceae bacterium R-7]
MVKLRHLVAGNWKMNGSRSMAAALIAELKTQCLSGGGGGVSADLLVCPPFPYLIHASEFLMGSNIALGAQDCAPQESGAHTGDVSAAMLKDCGCSHVILGHSERRTDHGESSAQVAAKAKAAQGAGLIAIVCVGETDSQRDAGETLKVVESQIVNSIPAGSTTANLVVAYEPVWAIGTGKTPTAGDVAAVHAQIRKLLVAGVKGGEAVRILYGGSVKPSNAAELMAVPEVNGALVGGASLKAADFLGIAAACG